MRCHYSTGFLLKGCLVLAILGTARGQVQGQSFALDTSITASTNANVYDFTLSYLQSGLGLPLQDNIWTWSFFLDPNTPDPTGILSPTGWKYNYDASSGEFDWLTEGPGGASSGDYGSYVIQPGQSLSGFELSTPLDPADNAIFAYDVQQNSDVAFGVTPGGLPAATPEPGVTGFLAAIMLCAFKVLYRRRRHLKERI